ncbi:MAG: hypothetical protein ACOZNI_29320 [Myxococcota bacterium]
MTDGSDSTGDWGRTLRLAVLAFVLAFCGVALGYGQLTFLWSAYHHGGL